VQAGFAILVLARGPQSYVGVDAIPIRVFLDLAHPKASLRQVQVICWASLVAILRVFRNQISKR
jgi:hypothetical protein